MRPLPLLLLTLGCTAPPDPKGADTDAGVDTDRRSGPRTVGDTAPPSGQVTLELLDDFLLLPFEGPSGTVPVRVTSAVHPLETLTLTATSSVDGVLAAPALDPDGTFAYPTAALSVGRHDLAFGVRDPDGSA